MRMRFLTRISWRATRSWWVWVPAVLAVASAGAALAGASSVASVLITAALATFVYGSSRDYASATIRRAVLSGTAVLGVAILAVSGGNWSAVSNTITVVSLLGAVWCYAQSIRSLAARSRA